MKKIINTLFLLTLLVCSTNCSLLTAAGLSSQGQPTKEVKGDLATVNTNSKVVVDHSEWDRLLKKHVDDMGFVAYQAFKDDKDKLDGYLKILGDLEPTEKWSVQELLAYYINLYNAATVQLILDNYPLKSIKDINGAFTKAFVKINNKELSLGGIENGVLRKMNEPRIHFAINCASFSCPKLLNEAFIASKIDEQLEQVTVGFINGNKNEISKNNPKFSKIFDWYGSDFKINGKKDIIGYVNRYSTTRIEPNSEYSFLEYDWSLNEKK
ncbi:MAG: DUF547 domain-containing protein [Bacteroidota bacterium]